MAENKKSVDELLKEIVIEEVSEYLGRPIEKDLPKNNTQANISKKTGIPIATLSRYLNPEAKSYPSLVEAMEVLAVIGKRESLLKFGERSSSQAAKFVNTSYREYLKLAPVVSADSEGSINNEEILRITNESTSILEKKITRETNWVVWAVICVVIVSHVSIIWQITDVKVMLKQVISK